MVNELLREIHGIENMNNAELVMLNVCQCHAWSLYYVTDNFKAINYAKEAIKLDSHNGKWHFLLGQNYRRLRRIQQHSSEQPGKDETLAFETAYRLSKNVLFGISCAQLYRESRNIRMANQIYKEVYNLQPTSCTVRLRLALGFIRAKEPKLARNCLEYVAERMPDSLMYTHYMGIFEENCNRNLRAALPWYERTRKKNNFGAEWQYIKGKKKIEPNWDPLPYLLEMLERYERSSDRHVQDTNIQIGLYYLYQLNDLPNACIYLTKAIKIDPSAQQLLAYSPIFYPFKRVNVYDVLVTRIRAALKNGRSDMNAMLLYVGTLKLCLDNRLV